MSLRLYTQLQAFDSIFGQVMVNENGREIEKWRLRNTNSVLLNDIIFKFNFHFKI
jgi:hypothetical protein